MFESDLKAGKSFEFKSKMWVQTLFVLSYLILIIIGVSTMIMLFTVSLTIALIYGGIFILAGLGGFLIWLFFVTKKIKINPEGITWKTSIASKAIKFVDFDEIEYFTSVFFTLETAKITDNNYKVHKIRVSLMTAPKKWYSEDLFRSIVDNYWRKANPNAKYSKKSIASSTSISSTTPPGTISLLTPRKTATQNVVNTSQGYKCPNCLIIHQTKQKFCPKCGARME